MIVAIHAGGYTDYMARTVGQKLSEALGQTIVFENGRRQQRDRRRRGREAAPDGHTFGTVIAAPCVNATLNTSCPTSAEGFHYVSLMSVAPLMMVGHPSLPRTTSRN